MTIIYGSCGDVDTKVLANIWNDFPEAKVINSFDTKITKSDIHKAVSEEKDILIMAGHGSSDGLFGKMVYAVDGTSKINAKHVIGVWCHAKDFAKKYSVSGFFTSMYISNLSEALFELKNRVGNITKEDITRSEIEFCNNLNSLIKESIVAGKFELDKWPNEILKRMPPKNVVEEYNHTNLEYIRG